MNHQEELLTFPCSFPLKIVGKSGDDFAQVVWQTIVPHAPDLTLQNITFKQSSAKTYTSATVMLTAQSKEQLDNIYRALTSHPRFQYVL
ncbi:MAG: DUF493 domain-containing protein [Neisseriaceae bacterium]|nr:DUF493 domain-containing protein [Neisseriaceae bacterium]MBQ9618896.1 DUF493 domain-containing protein [Neisseriaceae bacterium]